MSSNIKEFRFHEGCLEHKWESSYRKLWIVMKGNTIYIFKDRPYIPENHAGTLTVDKTTKFEVRPEKPNNYKFILYTSNRGRINTFKSDKKSERDLWRGYIVGVARQKVPDDLDLPRDIINRIKQDVANFHLANDSPEQFDVVSRTSSDNRSSTSNVSTISPQQSVSSGRSNPNRRSVMSGDSGVSVSVSQRSPSSGSGSMTIGGIGGGPFMRHKFTNAPEDYAAPSWFFEACTREKAESYLAIAAENKFGDTLMRESTKFKQDGSYVISKRIVRQGRSSVEHYEVIRVDRGYKIKVENQHDAMRNLTDVMNYFVHTSGSYGTIPLSTNRLSDYGMTEDPYNTGRIQLEDRVAAEPVPDYEEPVQTKPQVPYQQPKTVTPKTRSASFNFHQAHYSCNTERHAKNYIQQPGKPSIDEIQTNIKAAATLHMLDKTIEPFDEPAREEDYINLKDLMRQEEDIHAPSLPPPPVPHVPLPEPHPVLSPSYVNKGPQPVFQAPAPAPALPKSERPKSVPNFADHLKSVQLNPVMDKKAVTNQPPPSVKHVTNQPPPVKHSQSPPVMKDNNRNGVPTPQQLGLKKTNFQKADPSKGEIMRPTGNPSLATAKSLDVPSSQVPSPQQMGLKPTKRESISEPDQQEVDNAPEIDQSNPGGVSTIKSMFERKPSESDDKKLSPRQQTGVGSLPVANNSPTMCGNPNPPGHLYVNNPVHVNNESPYDDARTPKQDPRGRLRSKSTPTISPEIREQLRVARTPHGNSTFIQQLENLVGGQQSKIPPNLRRHSTQQYEDDDDNYEYLPD